MKTHGVNRFYGFDRSRGSHDKLQSSLYASLQRVRSDEEFNVENYLQLLKLNFIIKYEKTVVEKINKCDQIPTKN